MLALRSLLVSYMQQRHLSDLSLTLSSLQNPQQRQKALRGRQAREANLPRQSHKPLLHPRPLMTALTKR